MIYTTNINRIATVVTVKRQLREMPNGQLQINFSAKAEGYSQRVLFNERIYIK